MKIVVDPKKVALKVSCPAELCNHFAFSSSFECSHNQNQTKFGATEERDKLSWEQSIRLTQVPLPAGSLTHEGETSDRKAVRFTAVTISTSFRVHALLSWAVSRVEHFPICETERGVAAGSTLD